MVEQSGVPVSACQRMQFRSMPPTNGFRREIFTPRRTGVCYHDPRVGMESADGVQGGVEKFRRIEMGDAKGDGSLRCGAQGLRATGQQGGVQPPTESETHNVFV